MKELTLADINLEGIRAVVFDLDGTLYDKRWLPWQLVWGDLRHAGLLASERKARRLLRGRYFGDADTFYQTLFSCIAQARHIPYMQAKEWYNATYMPLMEKTLRTCHHAGAFVEPLLKALRQRGIRTAVFSDYSCVDEKLKALRISPEWFDFREAAPDLGGLKPNCRVYEKLMQLLQVAPDEALMIGDRDDTDGVGARAVGMKFLRV
ncbi:MAG: HAD family hydrolase [Paludibacteraceae bacterium]|nr:HAD family hydrolase [Paludibacteraceae bacterium]MBQ9705444.1 HAD family hydrolase [Paludibacteraceae bacterium]